MHRLHRATVVGVPVPAMAAAVLATVEAEDALPATAVAGARHRVVVVAIPLAVEAEAAIPVAAEVVVTQVVAQATPVGTDRLFARVGRQANPPQRGWS